MKSSSSFHINLSKNVDITGNMSGLNKSLTWVRGELVITILQIDILDYFLISTITNTKFEFSENVKQSLEINRKYT